ncbi:MAG: hypothetical protein HY402_02410 [Elusimicrobia bacterium]|nr:hypothetical protein [Elusimicrobiota bacterium]
MLKEQPRILVIRLSSLGDIALTLPVYARLKARWPQGKISVLVKPVFVELLRGQPGVDEVLAWEGWRRTVSEIRRRRFELLVDLHGSLRSRMLSLWSRAGRRVRYPKSILSRRGWVWFGKRGGDRRHTLERYLAVLPRLGVFDPQTPYRFLVVQTAFLGDAALTLPLLKALREGFPRSQITVLSASETAGVFQNSRTADQVWSIRKRRNRLYWLALPIWIWRIRRQKFSAALLPHRSHFTALLAYGGGVPYRVGFASSAWPRLLSEAVSFDWKTHDSERNLSLLYPLLPKASREVSWRWHSDPERLRRWSENLRKVPGNPSGPRVAIAPGSAWRTKRWFPGRFAELARRLQQEQGVQILWIGSIRDVPIVREIVAAMDDSTSHREPWNMLSVAGKTENLQDLVALLSLCQLLITNDSGPMHIAAGVGTPVLALFGPTTRELGFFPQGPRSRVLEATLACRPCSLHGGRRCPEGHFLCMRLITVDEVSRAAGELLRHESLVALG